MADHPVKRRIVRQRGHDALDKDIRPAEDPRLSLVDLPQDNPRVSLPSQRHQPSISPIIHPEGTQGAGTKILQIIIKSSRIINDSSGG